jgi:uncharacterized protein YcfJ
MNTPSPLHERGKLHPLLILAAVAVLLFSLVGTAAIMGWLPSSRGDARNNLRDAERAAAAANEAGMNNVAGAPVAGTIGSNAPVAGTLAQGAVQPGTTGPGVVQQVQPTPYNSQALAGYSGMGGTTASGGPAPAPVYLPEERAAAAVTQPTRSQRHERVADTESESRWCATCGNVESVRAIATRAQGSGVGAAGGAILGGLLGNQVGSGHGRQLATVARATCGRARAMKSVSAWTTARCAPSTSTARRSGAAATACASSRARCVPPDLAQRHRIRRA